MNQDRNQQLHTTRTIANERLSVILGVPGQDYRGARFDWSGFIKQVTWDGIHTFCTTESPIEGEGSGGEGLCNEYGISEPVGYDEVAVGEKFPKFGIGLLTKEAASEYFFMHPYPIEAFRIDEDWGKSHVSFHTDATMCNGYALDVKKDISIEENSLVIQYHIKNTGTKTIKTTEYVHNFLKINDQSIGSDYVLTLPEGVYPWSDAPDLTMKGRSITWKNSATSGFYALFKEPWRCEHQGWELLNTRMGVGIRETVSFVPVRFALWGNAHVVSPEVFCQIDVEPGSELKWTRRYDFICI